MNKNKIKRMASQTIKKIGRVLLNYCKLFLIPFVFVFMLLALFYKGLEVLLEKIKAHKKE